MSKQKKEPKRTRKSPKPQGKERITQEQLASPRASFTVVDSRRQFIDALYATAGKQAPEFANVALAT